MTNTRNIWSWVGWSTRVAALWATTALGLVWAGCDRAPTRPDERYMAVEGSGGAEVLDKSTGLIWQRCPIGKAWDGSQSQCTGTAKSLGWQQAKALDAPGTATPRWRLPSYVELLTLVDMSCTRPAVNAKWFADKDIVFLWSGSPYKQLPDYAWGLKYLRGEIVYENKVEEAQVRLVRDSQ